MHDEHINVTPLIDVIMCLIIFFLVCGQLAREEGNDKVQIPRAQVGQELDEQRGRLLINVVPRERLAEADASTAVNPDAEPAVYIRGERIGLENLTAYLRKEKQETPDVKVILRADQDLVYDWISPVLISCAQANIKSVNFSTRER